MLFRSYEIVLPTIISQTVTENLSVTYDYTPLAASAVPELSTWAMMLLGFAGLGLAGFRQTHKHFLTRAIG